MRHKGLFILLSLLTLTMLVGPAWGWQPTFRGCQALVTGEQTIPNAQWTAINYPTEAYDTDDIHSNTTNNTRFTVPAGVTKVRVDGWVMYNTNTVGRRVFVILKNGTSYIGMQDYVVIPDATGGVVSTGVIPCVAGDYYEIKFYQNSGGNLNTFYNSDFVLWGAMEIIEDDGTQFYDFLMGLAGIVCGLAVMGSVLSAYI